MEKNVLLNIRESNNGEETLRLICDGKFSETDGGYRISWDGSESFGREGEENSVEVYGDGTFIFGIGASDRLMLGKNITCAVIDNEQGGGVPVRFFVSELENKLTERGGDLLVDYTVSNPITPVARKRFEITVTE